MTPCIELGFDDTTPNEPVTISSWAWDLAHDKGLDIVDDRAVDVRCYAPTHTFVEKLQTISTKYRQLQLKEDLPANFLRHYYDVYCLLEQEAVREFMNAPAYIKRKEQRFRQGDELIIAKNPAFLLVGKSFSRAKLPPTRKSNSCWMPRMPKRSNTGRLSRSSRLWHLNLLSGSMPLR